MQAIIFKGENEVSVETVAKPNIIHPNDVIINVTTAAISSLDMSVFHGRTSIRPGTVLGHENVGIVTEVGNGVSTLEVGNRVVLPFNVACGFCQNCEEGYTGFCTNTSSGYAGGTYGYVARGPYEGGQAEQLRVPYADFNALKLPEGDEHEDSFALLADIFPTGWHGTELANLKPGESVAIFGAGPVGAMAAYSAHIKGASEIYSVDRVPSRLDAVEENCGAIPINFEEGDPVEQIKDQHGGMVDKGIDAVGYQAIDPETDPGDATYDPARENPAVVLNQLIQVVRPTGELGIPGLYVPSDPGAPDEIAAQGRLGIDFGKFFEKGLKCGTGQCNVKQYNRYLRDQIIKGRADPSWIVSQRVRLNEVPEVYRELSARKKEFGKVLISPEFEPVPSTPRDAANSAPEPPTLKKDIDPAPSRIPSRVKFDEEEGKLDEEDKTEPWSEKELSDQELDQLFVSYYRDLFVNSILRTEDLAAEDVANFKRLENKIVKEDVEEDKIDRFAMALASEYTEQLEETLPEPIPEEQTNAVVEIIKRSLY